jgi:hypothetical protein
MGEGGDSTETSSKDIILWRLLTLSFDTLKLSTILSGRSQDKSNGECPVGVYILHAYVVLV